MSRSVNKVILVGHVGQDPDLAVTKSGKAVVNLSLATNGRKDDNGDQSTEWHRLTLWERLAVFTNDYVSKGDRVYVEGRLKYGTYERDGVTIPT